MLNSRPITELKNIFPNPRIGRGAPITGWTWSSDMSQLDFCLWIYSKDKVYNSNPKADIKNLYE